MAGRMFRAGVLGLGLLGCCGSARAQAVTPVPQLDLSRFSGTWYEVALLPNKAEKKCVGDALRLYDVSDKPRHFQSVLSCRVKQGYPNIRNEDGRVHNRNGDGSLEVSYFLLLHRKTWVIGLAPDYSWALVGNPNHKNLWLLTHNPHPSDAVLAEMKAKATAEGFDVTKLVVMTQSSR